MICAAGLLLGGCSVRTLAYEALTPSRANAAAALAATASSDYLRATVGRETLHRTVEDMVASEGLTGCLSNGSSFRLTGVVVDEAGISGSDDQSGSARRLTWAEMSALGRPVDHQVMGYFPVREDALECPAS